MTPADEATLVAKITDHHSAGMLLRCHHLETVRESAPISAANASLVSQSSITERNDNKSGMAKELRQSVLNRKANLAADNGKDSRHYVFMSAAKAPPSLFKRQFIARTAIARERAGKSQEQMAAELGISQGTYHKYESRSPLPHHLIVSFCTLCKITPEWLYTAAVELPESKPQRRKRRLKKAA